MPPPARDRESIPWKRARAHDNSCHSRRCAAESDHRFALRDAYLNDNRLLPTGFELRNAFGRVSRTIPVYRNTDLSALFASLTDDPLKQVAEAIDTGDSTKFKVAYTKLTFACNACHLSQDHPMVVIRVPHAAGFPDQDFRVHR